MESVRRHGDRVLAWWRVRGSLPEAQRSYSRDGRSERKQVCIGLVVSRSADRREKGNAMHDRFAKRIREGLEKMAKACARKKERRVLPLAQQPRRLECEDLWRTYIQLTEAEAVFRIHKSDLRIRPICGGLQRT